VTEPLGDVLDLEQHTIGQLSTLTAVPEQGDFGIGTFDHLDGEGIPFWISNPLRCKWISILNRTGALLCLKLASC